MVALPRQPLDLRRCPRCTEWRAADDWMKGGGGSRCKACHASAVAAARARVRAFKLEARAARRAAEVAAGEVRLCRRCREDLPVSMFTRSSVPKWRGFWPYCKPCEARRRRRYPILGRVRGALAESLAVLWARLAAFVGAVATEWVRMGAEDDRRLNYDLERLWWENRYRNAEAME
jgi:hypothetical protein